MSEAADEAIRLYLRLVNEPDTLVDKERIAELQQQAEGATDPLERLRAYGELERLQSVDDKRIRADFVRHAKAWAQANGISAEAFKQMNAAVADLRAAGLLGKRGASPKRAATPAAPGEVRKRKPRVSTQAIEEHVPASGQFTVRSVAEASGASDATVRKFIDDMISRGEVVEDGTASTGTRGRAPLAFRRR
jgi:hypothetical protein